jgi:diguanylate cyclase (GGDEF)-like protein/PAS domain S-box-containing protein
MDAKEHEGSTGRARDDRALDDLLLAPAAILEGLPDSVVASARDGRIVFVNALAEQLFGYSAGELVGQQVQMLWPERVRARYTGNMELYFDTEHPMRFSTAVLGLRRDGSEFVGEMSWGIVETNGGPLLLAVGRDVSDRHAAEVRLRAVAAMGERALAGADPADLGAEAVELMRTTLPVAGAEVRVAGSAIASSGDLSRTGARVPIGPKGELFVTTWRELSDDEISFMRAIANTLAGAMARLRETERMREEALHDPLTGLANRTLLRDHLELALARSRRDGGVTAVLFVDLDNFKRVNDTYGHAVGDEALVEIGRRLRMAVRPGDTVARFGGDEFVVVCEHVDRISALAIAHRVEAAIRQPLAAGDAEHELSASVGVGLGSGHPDALIASADAAGYRAKAAGGGRVELSTDKTSSHATMKGDDAPQARRHHIRDLDRPPDSPG